MNRDLVISELNDAYAKAYKDIINADYFEAKNKLNKLYFKSKSLNYTQGIKIYFIYIILILYYTEHFHSAISLIKNHLNNFKRTLTPHDLTLLYTILGSCLSLLSDFENSSFYLQKALTKCLKQNPILVKRITSIYLSLTNNYHIQSNYEKAITNVDLGLGYFVDEKIIEKHLLTFFYLNVRKIIILIETEKINEATFLFKSLNTTHSLIGLKEKANIARIEIMLLLNTKNYNSKTFVETCNYALTITKKLQNHKLKLTIYNYLQTHYENEKNHLKALYYINKYIASKEEIVNVPVLKIKDYQQINTENIFNNDFILFKKKDILKASTYQANFLKNKFKSKKIKTNITFKVNKDLSTNYIGTFNLDKEDNSHLFILANAVSEGLAGTYISFMLDGIIKSIIYNAENYNLKKIIKDINNILSDSLKGNGFVSLWAGIINTNRNTLESVNAGSIAVYVLTSKHEIVKLNSGCTILGMFNELPEYISEIIEFNNGDTLFAFSDGVRETINYSENNFNTTINKLIKQYSYNKSINFNKLLLNKISKFENINKIENDISYLTIDYQ